MTVKTRFAPSPTGYLHVGGLRTALYAFLFARKNRGKFVLRIEDTDQNRFIEGATEHLIEMVKHFDLNYDEGPDEKDPYSNKWLGLNGPYIQSQRFDLYKKYAAELIAKDGAYYCFCSAERLTKLREEQTLLKQPSMYDRHCRSLTQEEIDKNLAAGTAHVIRQKIPTSDIIKFKDLIRGMVKFEGKLIDDQILIKSDGFPTYHLANVVDDHLMETTHVIRGEEWLPSTPKHIWLYQAFGWQPPEFAHIPLLLNADRSKLSKRQGDVSVESYLEKGYQEEAILNFIAFLGWHPGGDLENEVFTLQELIDHFSLEKVHKAGAIFDLSKLDWFDWQWRRRKHLEAIEKIALELDAKVEITSPKKGEKVFKFSNTEAEKQFIEARVKNLISIAKHDLQQLKYAAEPEKLIRALITVEEKILRDPKNIEEYINFYFNLPDYPASLLTHEKMQVDEAMAKKAIEESKKVLANMPENDFANIQLIQEKLIELIQNLGLKNGQVLWPLRAACTGESFSPGTFEVLWVLGKEESLKRLETALEKL